MDRTTSLEARRALRRRVKTDVIPFVDTASPLSLSQQGMAMGERSVELTERKGPKNDGTFAGLLKSPHAEQWRARFPEIAAEIPHAPHICQPYNNTIASTTYCTGTQFFDVPPSAYTPWGVTPPVGNAAVPCGDGTAAKRQTQSSDALHE